MRPDLVLFDCDGVLVDTERIQVAVQARLLTQLGWPIEADEVVERWMGRTSEFQLADIRGRLGEDAVRRYNELATEEVHASFEAELTEIDGIGHLLDVLVAAVVPTCIASCGSQERMKRTLGITGLHDHFSGRIFSALEVEHGKPAPDLFLHAAETMGLSPVRSVVIEDSVYGVEAGVSAGMRVLGYGGGLATDESLRAAGAEVFGHMSEVPGLLGLSTGGRRTQQ
jgi:beta-phosphoglucomutase-like phosphatase (HAD superfamily)